MFSRSSLVDVHLAYKIKKIVSKCSGVLSSVLANTLQAAGQHIFSQRLKPQSDDTIKTYRNPKTMHEKVSSS